MSVEHVAIKVADSPCIMSVQYTGGCSVHWGHVQYTGGMFSTLGAYHEYSERNHEYTGKNHGYSGGYPKYTQGCSVHWGGGGGGGIS